MDPLQHYFNPLSLQLAWERMLTSTGRDVKDFFGIQLYSRQLSKNLERLSSSILSGQYRPTRPFKYYEPKASYTHRTKSVLHVEDALVFQAIANKIAEQNFDKLSQFQHCVYSQVLHKEVHAGNALLDNPYAEYYFFEFYVPYYNRFLASINEQVENNNIHYKLETDITGFFDAIPHANLLLLLRREYNVDDEVLNLLGHALNVWSGTRDSLTPGVGIPQGAAASFFLGNLFLSKLDSVMCSNSFHYYRYLDDIRVYAESEEIAIKALVKIDIELKGEGLNLNTKKTAIEPIWPNRKKEKKKPLNDYEKEDDPSKQTSARKNHLIREMLRDVQNADLNEQPTPISDEDLSEVELLALCYRELALVEVRLQSRQTHLLESDDNLADFLDNENEKREFINEAYRWRTAMAILREFGDSTTPSQTLIPIWLFGLEHFFWKANHFCWNLNQYGKNESIKMQLKLLFAKFEDYEWVQYQILSNLATAQQFQLEELSSLYQKLGYEVSPLVRLGLYKVLLTHANPDIPFWNDIHEAIKQEKEFFIKKILIAEERLKTRNRSTLYLKNWLGL